VIVIVVLVFGVILGLVEFGAVDEHGVCDCFTVLSDFGSGQPTFVDIRLERLHDIVLPLLPVDFVVLVVWNVLLNEILETQKEVLNDEEEQVGNQKLAVVQPLVLLEGHPESEEFRVQDLEIK